MISLHLILHDNNIIIITVDRKRGMDFFVEAAASQAIISKIWRCDGNEQELLRCHQESRPDCDHDRDAGVFCYGEINHVLESILLSTYNIVIVT